MFNLQKMNTRYNHQTEERIYQLWLDSGGMTPPSGAELLQSDTQPFTIIMPPPNANDPLHVGHAMFVAIEDILIRFARMNGMATLWLPGTDHAGIETQFVFEKKLQKQGKSRFDYDRESLYNEIYGYVKDNSDVSLTQMKRLGASADWSRTKFTLDENIVDQVLSTFEKMHDEGLITRKLALVNFSPKAGTSYSELEVVYKERTTPLYYVKYRLKNNPNEWISVATTRPEPIFADTHLAVNPRDKKRKKLIGELVLNPLTDVVMEIIGDEFVDPKFGTGIVKLTPAHDHNDFQVAKRHQLPLIEAIDMQGRITKNGGKYAGLKIAQARLQVIADLEAKGLIEKIDTSYTNRVATCYKTGGDIEPLPLSQFFVKVKPLTKKVLDEIDSGKVKVIGSGHDKILQHWLEHLEDWNISRQIVWGIRMPVWYKIPTQKSKVKSQNINIMVGFLDKNGDFVQGKIGELVEHYSFEEIEKGLQTLFAPEEVEYVVSRKKPGKNFLQETDTFDTWFSSAQWPVVTLKTTREGDFDYYYPTTVMETAYDILMFWVMRMMMMGMYLTGSVPFSVVYLHGLVRDEKGQKMSKSKGNVINPLDLVDKYGADALRMALVMSTTPGNDSAVGEGKVKGMRNFANKVWNAARFVKEFSGDEKQGKYAYDQIFIQKMSNIVEEISQDLQAFRVGLAAEKAHNEFWHWYCDEAIEMAKQQQLAPTILRDGLNTWLKILHPFMPFVTESIALELEASELLINSSWPKISTSPSTHQN